MKYLKSFEFYRNDLLQKFKNNKWTYSDIYNKDDEHTYIEECVDRYLRLYIGDVFEYIK